MDLVIHKRASVAIACDAGRIQSPAREHFSARYWQDIGAVEGVVPGRGRTWFIDTPFGHAVLRRYLRGGWAAALSRDRYLFTTAERSRPFREFRLLGRLRGAGLNVPRPLAALCEHRGILSRGALLTERILPARVLADSLPELGDADWATVGGCLARFHRDGVWHADLNARNVLLDNQGEVFLVDFDRARYTPGRSVDGRNNLQRLRRSLARLWPDNAPLSLHAAWERLLDGYRA